MSHFCVFVSKELIAFKAFRKGNALNLRLHCGQQPDG